MKKENENLKEILAFFQKKDTEKKEELEKAKKAFLADLTAEFGKREANKAVKLIASF